MKKMMKVFVSLLVVAMMVVLVPVQQVKATNFLLIKNSSTLQYKTSFVDEMGEGIVYSVTDYFENTHTIGFVSLENVDEEYAVLKLVYESEKADSDDRHTSYVLESLRPTNQYVGACEQVMVRGNNAEPVSLEFTFEKARYNDEYLYYYAGVYDAYSSRTASVKFKIKNPFYDVPIQFVNISETFEDVAVGYTDALSFNIVPEVVTMDKTLTWTSSDESVATVDENGVVTGVSKGVATITATSVNGKSDSCEITVGDKIEELIFEQDVYYVNHYDEFVVSLSTNPVDGVADLKDATWEIEDTSIIRFDRYDYTDSGRTVETVNPGSTIITVTTPQGVSASCVVSVDAPIATIRISYDEYIEVYQDHHKDLGTNVKIYPENTNHDKTLSWTSSDESIVTVDENGVITGISVGEAVVKATAKNGVFAEQKIRVKPHIMIENVNISKESLELFVGDVYSFTAYIDPSNATISKDLTWTSSDESVATVEAILPNVTLHTAEARIYAVGGGSCVITATSVNGISDSITVNVSDGAVRIFGDNRYDTAFKSADELKKQLYVEKFSNIIVASGTGFADALAGSYLAAEKKAPILMTDKKQVNIDKLVAYINENLASGGTVYILGGYAAVSEDVDNALSNYVVKRLAGKNRYETNLLILKAAGYECFHDELVVATGTNFADSLSVSATGKPILLVGSSLTTEQRRLISRQAVSSNTDHIYIVGGTSAVSKKIENAIKDALPKSSLNFGDISYDITAKVERIAGDNRYETSMKVAEKFFPDADKAVLAYAKNYPDGLSGGALANAIKAPLLLTDGINYSITSKHTIKNKIRNGYVLGGNTLVTDDAVHKIFGNSK